jgi:excisionase family DNA binding protein
VVQQTVFLFTSSTGSVKSYGERPRKEDPTNFSLSVRLRHDGCPVVINTLMRTPMSKIKSLPPPSVPLLDYLTLDEAAGLLRVSRSTVKKLVQARKIAATYPSAKRVLIARATLDDYLANGGCRQ